MLSNIAIGFRGTHEVEVNLAASPLRSLLFLLSLLFLRFAYSLYLLLSFEIGSYVLVRRIETLLPVLASFDLNSDEVVVVP